MRKTLIYVASREQWLKRFGHLPAHPLLQYDGDGLYDRKTGHYESNQSRDVCKPYLIGDCPDHIGPSGRIVHGRAGKREEIKRSDGKLCEWEPVTNMPRGLANEQFAKRFKAASKRDKALVKLSDKSGAWMEDTLRTVGEGLAVETVAGRAVPSARVKPKHRIGRDRELERKQREVLNKHGLTT